jgi:mono/diheme cytochrome c family protein
MTPRRCIRVAFTRYLIRVLAVLTVSAATARARDPVGDTPHFQKKVLPILSAHCLKCHGEKKKGGLDLRSPASMLKGGESGPALVPGAADKSLLFEMVHKGEMPPQKQEKLTAKQVAILKAWIDAGARTTSPAAVKETLLSKITEQDRQFWSFQKPVRSPVPRVRHVERVRTSIDAFILARLEAKGLTLSPDADRAVLLRRIYFDLIGLPPSPVEVKAFLADTRPDAYERVVDRLLASPHYGERWGRHWLDAAGYADSVGGDNDPGQVFPREGMWRYRDYVVRALNDDKPFDRFLVEQLAGDELDDWRSAPVFTQQIREHLIATGFLRTSVDHTTESELNRPFERYQVLHDTIENLTSNLLGLTVACARCHDHKFDPISQVEYYQLLAVLKPVYNPEKWIQPQDHHLADVPAKEKEAIDRHNGEIDRQVAERKKKIAALRDTDRSRVAVLEQEIAALNGRRKSFGKIQAAWEASEGRPPPTYVFRRGNLTTPGAEVQPGVFAVLTDPKETTLLPASPAGAKTSGLRTAWARWLTRPDHPLTARVFVNRIWQHHFGEGIVATSDNFGHLGARPTHPELLDWLSGEFVQSGWKIKALHRLIVLSSVYRQSSTPHSEGNAIDPGNQLLWRMRLRRLESECVRDAVLAVSGKLDRTLTGPPVPIEPRPDGMVVVPAEKLATPTAAWRRSLYLFARRNYNVTLLNVFDQPVMATNCTRRIHSAVPLQSLTLLNDAFMLEQARHFAERVAAAGASQENQIEAAFQMAFARLPTAAEIVSSRAFLKKIRERYTEQQALTRLCHMLLCANEFLYVG